MYAAVTSKDYHDNDSSKNFNLTEFSHGHLTVLDGWRAISICCVLIGHLLPLGPGKFSLNETTATTGMAIFFTLSGFLITKTLLDNPNIYTFAIRRILRIVPLAWAAMIILLIANGSSLNTWVSNLLFYSNNINTLISNGGGHLWSLCVEMQIYLFLAAILGIVPRIGIVLIPIACTIVTLLRIKYHVYIDMVTWYRCDEILSGSIIAMIYTRRYGEIPQRLLAWLHPSWIFPLLFICAHPSAGFFQYARPYFAALAVGATLYNSPIIFIKLSRNQLTKYLAKTSYALYIVHGVLTATWLNTGTTFIKYSKRPLLFISIFVISHLSTYKFESYFINYAKRITSNKKKQLL